MELSNAIERSFGRMKPTSSPHAATRDMKLRAVLHRFRRWFYALGIASAFMIGLATRPIVSNAFRAKSEAETPSPAGNGDAKTPAGTPCKPGPWGSLEFVSIKFNAPAELPTVQSMMETPVQWHFNGYNREDYVRLINSIEMPAEHLETLLSRDHLKTYESGVVLTPPVDLVLDLPMAARDRIYRVIAGMPENSGYFAYFQSRDLEERLKAAGVSPEVAARLRAMVCPHGKYLVFSGLQALLSIVPTAEERMRVMQVLTEQKSVLIKLKVDENSNLDELARYWDKAGDSINTKALLTAMKGAPGGATVDLVKLLPPVPASLVYTFPNLHAHSKEARVRRDCHWTAFNFFNDKADDGYGDSDYVEKRFMAEFTPVDGAPRYGDLIFLTRPNGSIIHSCTYIADDLVFTKNGATACHPWMFARIDDLLELYSYAVEPNEALRVNYWRKKAS
jgi:5-methylcytosine-specific restriction endonuclease McrA